MRLTDLAEATISSLLGRLVRRAVLFALLGILAIVTLYYASAAGTVALALEFGPFYAYLIMAGVYALAAIAVLMDSRLARAYAMPRPAPPASWATTRVRDTALASTPASSRGPPLTRRQARSPYHQ